MTERHGQLVRLILSDPREEQRVSLPAVTACWPQSPRQYELLILAHDMNQAGGGIAVPVSAWLAALRPGHLAARSCGFHGLASGVVGFGNTAAPARAGCGIVRPGRPYRSTARRRSCPRNGRDPASVLAACWQATAAVTASPRPGRTRPPDRCHRARPELPFPACPDSGL